MTEDARYKLGEADFFLKKMRSAHRSEKLDALREFHYYFSAFLAAARSPLQILCPTGGDWGWCNLAIANGPPADKLLYDTFRDLRDAEIHHKRTDAGVQIEMVPEHEIRRRVPYEPRAYAYIPRLPGMGVPQVGIAVYTIRIGTDDREASDCCSEYLDLIRRLVDHREAMPSW